jgi:hypothetical protein
VLMRDFFISAPRPNSPVSLDGRNEANGTIINAEPEFTPAELVSFSSDEETDEDREEEADDEEEDDEHTLHHKGHTAISTPNPPPTVPRHNCLPAVPPRK